MNVMVQKLSTKMIVSLTLIFVLVTGVSNYFNAKTQESQLLDAMILGADQLSKAITSATWHAMLADHRQAAYQIMETIAKNQGINRIRIYNKEGRIMFSTVPHDTGHVDKDAEACSMCHSTLQPLVKVDVPSRSRTYRAVDGSHNLAMVTPIYNEPQCSQAGCHAHPVSQTVLGVLDLSFDLTTVDAEVAQAQDRTIMVVVIVVVLCAVFVAWFTRHFVAAPIRRLIHATSDMSAMHLDKPIEIHSSEELGALAHSFDTMRNNLRSALEENDRFTHSLESQVEERTRQLRIANQKLLQSDRLACLGQLSASVAHEINNPLSGVLNLSMLLQRILKDDGVPPERLKEFRQYLSQVVTETSRVGRIVQDLLAFSRRSKPQRTPVDINVIISSTVNLLAHKLKLMNIGIELHLDPHLMPVECDSSQIQQVLINLIMNGAEAVQGMSEGKVLVSTDHDPTDRLLTLEVRDNGSGIPPENLAKIFDPFFTTKGEAKGVGLGLAVVYGIIHAHKGDIEVHSIAGRGTTFTVTLPSARTAMQENEKLTDAGHAV
jgi:two-component system, NtrC family, sensor kinase